MKHEINYLVEFQRVALVVRTSENTVAAKIKIKRKKKTPINSTVNQSQPSNACKSADG